MLVEENKEGENMNQIDPEMQRAIQVANQADEMERMAELRELRQNQQIEQAQMNAARGGAPDAEREHVR